MKLTCLLVALLCDAHVLSARNAPPTQRSGIEGRLAQASPGHADQALVRTATWTESWPDAAGNAQPREVKGEIWNEAISAALARHQTVHLPKRLPPYYLDGPIVLGSGQKLTADADTEIRLKPGCNTCMVRNAHIAGFADRPVPAGLQPDTGITIEGGIWTTLATSASEANGNLRGHSAKQQPVPGTHGVILLHNVRKVIVRNVTVRQSKAFAVHLGNVEDFLVEGIRLDQHRRDGVHVNGPASHGVIRDVSGDSHDDTVSIAAWDWRNYAPSFGPIRHLLIERVAGVPAIPNSTDAVRLLPGVKRYDDGAILDCPISDIVLRDLRDLREIKCYNQPNLEIGRDKDSSAGIGELRNILFEKLIFRRPGSIQIHADTDGLSIEDVALDFPPSPDFRLVELGPKSQTYKGGSADPTAWREIFSPDLDCTVRNLRISRVRAGDSITGLPVEKVVRVISQTPNPDYPRTTPKGGTGRGIWVR